MNPVASPRHPWKAFAAVIAMFALVHGAGARVFSHDEDSGRVHIGHAVQVDDDCPDVDVHFGDGFPFDDDGPDDISTTGRFDHGAD